MHTLDFGLVEHLRAPGIVVRLPEATESSLVRLPETFDRARAAVRFAYWAESSAEVLHVPVEEEVPMREACLRASLGEFVSMEETAKRDFATLAAKESPPMITDSLSPLLHVLRELRNVNFHLATVRITEDTKAAIWRFDGKDHELNYSLTLVDGFTLPTFMSLRNAKNYHRDSVSKLIDWFDLQQREWGVPHMIVVAVSQYADDLLSHVARDA
jgi:hypothetical protein